MNIQEYQQWTRTTAVYPRPVEGVPVYPILGLTEEIGELGEAIVDGGDRDRVIKELGDCLWYLCRIADDLDLILDPGHRPSRIRSTDLYQACANIAGLAKRTMRDGTTHRQDYLPHLNTALAVIETTAESVAGVDLIVIAAANITKLEDRKARGKIHGKGDDR